MDSISILNLYAGLGGNRRLWQDCQVTAVELDPAIASVYQRRFVNDTVVCADAHEYLEQHYRDFDSSGAVRHVSLTPLSGRIYQSASEAQQPAIRI